MSRPADPLARPKLLRAAREVFAREGLTAARVEDIARRAGLSKGAFYLHFPSKEAAFEAVLDHFLVECTRFNEQCRPNLEVARTVEDVRRYFRDHDTQLLEFLWNNRDIAGAFYRAGFSARYQPVLEAFLAAQAEEAAAQMRSLQARGLYRADLDVALVATCVVGMYHHLTRQFIDHKTRPDFAAAAETLGTLLLYGLAHPDQTVNDRPVNSEPT